MSLSRCRPCLLRISHSFKTRCPSFALSRRPQSSSTRVQIRQLPSPAIQQALDRIELVLHALESHSCVSSAKVQLALRGLQQYEAPVRIGVLGPHCEELLRAFLQPDKEDALWFEDLSKWIDRHRQSPTAGGLLRYGPFVKRPLADPEGASGGIAILTAPVEVLRTNALELLIVPGAINLTTSPVFFLPNGRLIEVPVHKALEYLGAGAAGLRKLLSSASPLDMHHGMVKRIVAMEKMDPGDISGSVMSVGSLNTPDMDGARTWILAGTTSTGDSIKPAVAAFIRDVLRQAAEELSKPVAQNIVSDIPTEDIGKAITSWSARAHASLKSDLGDTGFGSKAWHKIDWWKLVWRVDDVGHVTRSVILEHFLQQTEREAIFLGGRIFQAGGTGEVTADYLPREIASEREDIIQDLVPGFQLVAQKAVARMLEITAATAGGGFLLGFAGFDLVISSAVAGAGVVGGLAHLRKRWLHEKSEFEEDVRERGRRVIWVTEKWAWDRLREVELAAKPEDARAELDELRGQVEEALVMLDRLSGRAGSGPSTIVRDASFPA